MCPRMLEKYREPHLNRHADSALCRQVSRASEAKVCHEGLAGQGWVPRVMVVGVQDRWERLLSTSV